MSKQKQGNVVRVFAICMAFVAVVLFLAGQVSAGSLEPSDPPGSTMKTLDEIPPSWSQTLSPASERFVLVLNDEAVLDKETGLVWARNANIANGSKTWEEAVIYCRNLNIGNRKGWRLPSVEELASLVDPSESDPALPSGYSSFFNNVYIGSYWSSTTYESNTVFAWRVILTGDSNVTYETKGSIGWVWPVRGGSSPILVPHTP